MELKGCRFKRPLSREFKKFCLMFMFSAVLIGSAFVTIVDAGSFSVAVQAVKRVLRNNTLKPLSDVYGQTLFTDNNVLFRGTVYVGTPPTPFTVIFDTGSHMLWLPKKGCKSSGRFAKNCASGINLYDPESSVTSHPTNTPFFIEYGTGQAKGEYYTDFLTFGSAMRFKNSITFGVGEEMEFLDEGVLGLPSSFDSANHGSSVMHEAWKQKLLDAPIFTVYMRKCPQADDCQPTGLITFGAIDKHNCDKIEGRVKVESDSIKWIFDVSGFQIGHAIADVYVRAFSDSGASAIYVPKVFFKKIMTVIKAKAEKKSYTVKCDTNATVTLTINSRQYTIPSHRMLKNLHNGDCAVRIRESVEEDMWVLGHPFIEMFCQVHNIDKGEISFAKVREQS
ncbi:Peptidase A1 domain-containing protein [Aphelenchoides besseyi]|nr:Peptidase A1 domain-containing protein [Aphelenchoides besseyi]